MLNYNNIIILNFLAINFNLIYDHQLNLSKI